MATKKELEDRIAALENEVALLRARPVIVSYYPQFWPKTYPYVTWGSGSVRAGTGVTAINWV